MPSNLRVAYRNNNGPDERNNNIGFRVLVSQYFQNSLSQTSIPETNRRVLMEVQVHHPGRPAFSEKTKERSVPSFVSNPLCWMKGKDGDFFIDVEINVFPDTHPSGAEFLKPKPPSVLFR